MCPWRPSFTLNVSGTFSEIGFGANVTGFGIANYFHRQADNVLIGKRWGEGELGFYTRAYGLISLPMTVVNNAVGSAVIPLLSRFQDDPTAWRRYFLRALALTCFGSYSVAVLLSVNSHEIIHLLLGPSWDYSGSILFYLSLSLFPITPMNAMGWVFISLDRSARWFRWGLLTSLAFPAAYYAGLSFRSVGVAIAYSLAVAVLSLPCIWYATKGTAITPVNVGKAIRSPFIAGVTTVIAGLLFRPLWAGTQPVTALLIGLSATTAAFVVMSAALVFTDPEQEPQRQLLWSLFKARHSAFSIDR
jgi:PST family polysaccharide transporter